MIVENEQGLDGLQLSDLKIFPMFKTYFVSTMQTCIAGILAKSDNNEREGKGREGELAD